MGVPLSPRAAKVAAVAVAALLAAFIALRTFIGVDLRDESYYAVFHLWWILGDGNDTRILDIHQTAASLVHPFARGLWEIQGFTGLILLLRLVWLAMALATAALLYTATRRIRSAWPSLLVSLAVIVFVPFSLPSASYNTMGELALVGTASLLLLALANHPNVASWKWSSLAFLGGAAASIAVIAYPPLLLPQLLPIAYLLARKMPRVLLAWILGAATTGFAWLAYASVMLGVNVPAMLSHTWQARSAGDGVSGKLLAALAEINSQRVFMLFVIAFLLLGAWIRFGFRNSRLWESLSLAIAIALLLGVSLLLDVTFHTRSHDVAVLLVALGVFSVGFGNARSLDTSPLIASVLRLWFWFGISAGATTAWFSLNGLMNFAIGAYVAVIATLVGLCAPRLWRVRFSSTLMTLALVAPLVLLIQSLSTSFYGESFNPLRAGPSFIKTGAFAGLGTTNERATEISRMTQFLDAQCGEGNRVLMLGMPGLYLLNPKEPTGLSAWPGDIRQDTYVQELRARFANPATAPDCIGVVEGAQMSVVERDLLSSSTEIDALKLSDGRRLALFVPAVREAEIQVS